MKKLVLAFAISSLLMTSCSKNEIEQPPVQPLPQVTVYCGECKGLYSTFNSSTNNFVGWAYIIELVPPVSGNNRLHFTIPYTGTPTIYSDAPIYNIGQNICSTGGTNFYFQNIP